MACRDLSPPTRDRTQVPCTGRRMLNLDHQGSPRNLAFKCSLRVYGSCIFLVISVSAGPLASKPPPPEETALQTHLLLPWGSQGTQGLFTLCNWPPQRDSSRCTEVGLCWLKSSHMRRERLSQEEAIQN